MFTQEQIGAALRVYAVTDDAWLDGRPLEQCVAQALEGGATFVQLRRKGASTDELVEQAKRLIPLCHAAGVPFVIDDDVRAAKLSGADGVHVGQSDTACARARAELGPAAIVGVSTQTPEQARAAAAAGANYLGVGAVAGTSTKPEAWVLSAAEIAEIAHAVYIPIVAIGGLNAQTIPLLAGTGVAGGAFVSAIFAAEDIAQATRTLAQALDQAL
jgi:thiamine-phosphate pyrophosphorylase